MCVRQLQQRRADVPEVRGGSKGIRSRPTSKNRCMLGILRSETNDAAGIGLNDIENPNIAKPRLGLKSLLPGDQQKLAERASIGTKRPSGPQPFIHIEGAVATPPPGHEHTSPADKAGFRAAVNKWLARIAREVGRAYSTKTEREAAEKFARSHRLSIAHAFTRRLVRADVVRELARLFEQSKGDHSIQVYNSEEQSIG
jgi:hypothetical protein